MGNTWKEFNIYYIKKIKWLTIVVSAMDPKLLIKMLHVTFTGGPVKNVKKYISVRSGVILANKVIKINK